MYSLRLVGSATLIAVWNN